MTRPDTRRAYERIAVQWPALWSNAKHTQRAGKIVDICINGAFFCPADGDTKQLHAGSWVRIKIPMPHLAAPMEIAGEVRWVGSKEGAPGVGLEFDHLIPEIAQYLIA